MCFAAKRREFCEQEDRTIKQLERQRLKGRSAQVMGKIWRQTETEWRRVGEGRMTNRKWSSNNKPYPEKCQIVLHSSRNICLGSQGRMLLGGIAKKTSSSLGKMWRARYPDTGWSAEGEEGESCLSFPALPWAQGLLPPALNAAGFAPHGFLGLILLKPGSFGE